MTAAWWQVMGANLFPYCIIAVAAHLMMSLGQTLFHRYLGHHRLGGRFFKNHTGFHHTDYSDNHLVSNRRPSLDGNNTPFFLIPSILVIGITYCVMPFDFLVVQISIMSISFGAHVYLDRQYHAEKPWLRRYNWFIEKQQLHFFHHQNGDYNYAVINSFWDRLFGTYKKRD